MLKHSMALAVFSTTFVVGLASPAVTQSTSNTFIPADATASSTFESSRLISDIPDNFDIITQYRFI